MEEIRIGEMQIKFDYESNIILTWFYHLMRVCQERYLASYNIVYQLPPLIIFLNHILSLMEVFCCFVVLQISPGKHKHYLLYKPYSGLKDSKVIWETLSYHYRKLKSINGWFFLQFWDCFLDRKWKQNEKRL